VRQSECHLRGNTSGHGGRGRGLGKTTRKGEGEGKTLYLRKKICRNDHDIFTKKRRRKKKVGNWVWKEGTREPNKALLKKSPR